MRLSSLPAAAVLTAMLASCAGRDGNGSGDSRGLLPLHPTSGEPALLTLRADSGYAVCVVRPNQPLAEFVAVWPDGTILWSPEFEKDGVRCLRAEIPRERVRLAADTLSKRIEDPALTERWFVIPDSAFDQVLVFDGKRVVSIASCAHHWESHPTAVATDYGIVAVEDGDRDGIVRGRSPELNKHLETWSRCVDELRGLIPAVGKPTSRPKDALWNSETGRFTAIDPPR